MTRVYSLFRGNVRALGSSALLIPAPQITPALFSITCHFRNKRSQPEAGHFVKPAACVKTLEPALFLNKTI